MVNFIVISELLMLGGKGRAGADSVDMEDDPFADSGEFGPPPTDEDMPF